MCKTNHDKMKKTQGKILYNQIQELKVKLIFVEEQQMEIMAKIDTIMVFLSQKKGKFNWEKALGAARANCKETTSKLRADLEALMGKYNGKK